MIPTWFVLLLAALLFLKYGSLSSYGSGNQWCLNSASASCRYFGSYRIALGMVVAILNTICRTKAGVSAGVG